AKVCATETRAPKPRTIALFHASVGSGHRVAAEAIAQAFADLTSPAGGATLADPATYPTLRPEVRDVLAFGRTRLTNANLLSRSFTGVVAPFYDWLWRHLFTGHLIWEGSPWIAHLSAPAFTQWIADRRPAAVICTHAAGANLAVGARTQTGLDFPLICVPTDYGVHGLWPHAHTDLFCVATPDMADELQRRGVSRRRIAITGIPIKPEFTRSEYVHPDKSSSMVTSSTSPNLTRNRANNKELPLLIVAGAGDPGPYRDFRHLLDSALPQLETLPNLQITIICGNDEEYRQRLEQQLRDRGRTRSEAGQAHIAVRAYVDDIAAHMASSALVVVKPGGLTCTECLAVGTPLLIAGNAYGQEGANACALRAAGAALIAADSRELVGEIATFLADPARGDALRNNAATLRHPHAAHDIAQRVLQLMR
ncbi:MAG: UDP-N-acetylglucosamine--LPS N-acetylglucosamine transferase, partial [Actinomycetes bacterium]|nr:UDP-N-acetylglucosamine--LPS N-acetylglucosamine transferase [Actinomycetes bacterium]